MGAGEDFEFKFIVNADCDAGVGLVDDVVHGGTFHVKELLAGLVILNECCSVVVDVEDVVTQHVNGEGHGCYLGFLDGWDAFFSTCEVCWHSL